MEVPAVARVVGHGVDDRLVHAAVEILLLLLQMPQLHLLTVELLACLFLYAMEYNATRAVDGLLHLRR